MNNLLFVGLCFLICYIVEKTTNVKPTVNYDNKFEYLPIITANIYADLFIIFATFTRVYYKILTLEDWYKKYRLSAMIAEGYAWEYDGGTKKKDFSVLESKRRIVT